MSKNITSSKTNRLTLDFLLHEGYVIRSQNGAGEYVWQLTEKGERFLEAELE